MKDKVLEIPKYGIRVEIWFADDGQVDGGEIKSKLMRGSDDKYDAAMGAVETMILNHAMSLIDIASKEYIEGVDTSVDFIIDEYGGQYE